MSEYSGPTDAQHEIRLPSAIARVAWREQVAGASERAHCEVFTQFVGNGAEITLRICDGAGTRLAEIREKIYENRCRATYEIGEDVEGQVHIEAELSAHGLTARSGELRVTPRRSVRNPQWSQSEARRGDLLTLSADVRGFPEGSPATFEIYEYDADGAHDLVTKIQAVVGEDRVSATWEFEYQADTDDIPTSEESERGYTAPEYFFRVKVGASEIDSPQLPFKDRVEILVRDEAGEPVPDQDYILHLPDGAERRGRSDASGRVREDDVPPGPWWIETTDSAGLSS